MKVLILEDEPLTASYLTTLLAQYDATIEVQAVLPSVNAATQWLKTHQDPDLILMDIHLEDDQCFTIFDTLNLDVPVIFTTAYDEYMVKAFKVNSVDYLMKPVNYEELEAALDKFKRVHQTAAPGLDQLLQSLQRNSGTYKNRFMVSIGSRLRTIELSDIQYFFCADKVTFLVTQDHYKFPIDYSLDRLTAVLDPALFFRVNRHVLVSHRCIQNIHVFPKGRLKLELMPDAKEDVLVSLDKVTPFKEWLGK